MTGSCSRCRKRFGFLKRLLGASLCSDCSNEIERITQRAKAQYPALLRDVWQGERALQDAMQSLQDLTTQARLTASDTELIHKNAFREFALEVLSDDILTEAEEDKLMTMGSALGITTQVLNNELRDILRRIFVARINDGRIPTHPNPRIVLKKGEVGYLETNADLLKEVAVREYRGGYSGFSFRIARGVRYHVGGVRGQSVVVGTEIQTADQGVLVVTSHRTVYVGSRKTIELPHTKLVMLDILTNAVRFHMSNRQNPVFLKLTLEDGDVVAAAVNYATQKLL